MMRRLPWAEIAVGLVAVAIALGVYAWAHRDQGELEESKRRGASVVEALESYRSAFGEYPDSLPQLVPDHSANLPEPNWGLQRWRYRAFGEAGDTTPDAVKEYFQLSVGADSSGYPVLYYDITARRWVLNN